MLHKSDVEWAIFVRFCHFLCLDVMFIFTIGMYSNKSVVSNYLIYIDNCSAIYVVGLEIA